MWNVVNRSEEFKGWSSSSSDIEVEVSAAGGRLTSLKYKGQEFLETQAIQTGNVFWTSPQSDWEWPPLPEHDSDDYQAMVDGPVLRLRSKVDSKLGFRIIKEYRFLESHQLEIKYGIVNQGREPKKVAPWEITRVPAGGLTSFVIDNDAPTWGNLEINIGEEFAEFKHGEEHDLKFFGFAQNGELYHQHSGVKLTKHFPYCPKAQVAPGEAAIEIYAAKTYVEVEQQGAYLEIAPGEIHWWTVMWSLSQTS